jgi:flagellar assembly protein FliH
MSLSNSDTTSVSSVATGRIISGPKSTGVTELMLYSSRQATLSLELEEDYLERVRKKAQDMAKEILSQAMVEAEQLRKQAQEQGRREGEKKIEVEVNKIKEQKAQECKALLESMRQASRDVWRSYRQDLVLLVQVMVEKILSVELETNRRASLASLLDQAVDMMDAKRRVVITIHPRDLDIMAELLEQARASGKVLEDCKVKTDESIDPGGLLLECDFGLVNNTIASRKAGLQEILEQLTLEETS